MFLLRTRSGIASSVSLWVLHQTIPGLRLCQTDIKQKVHMWSFQITVNFWKLGEHAFLQPLDPCSIHNKSIIKHVLLNFRFSWHSCIGFTGIDHKQPSVEKYVEIHIYLTTLDMIMKKWALGTETEDSAADKIPFSSTKYNYFRGNVFQSKWWLIYFHLYQNCMCLWLKVGNTRWWMNCKIRPQVEGSGISSTCKIKPHSHHKQIRVHTSYE